MVTVNRDDSKVRVFTTFANGEKKVRTGVSWSIPQLFRWISGPVFGHATYVSGFIGVVLLAESGDRDQPRLGSVEGRVMG